MSETTFICRERVDYSLMTFYNVGGGKAAQCCPIRNVMFVNNELTAPRSGQYELFRNQALMDCRDNRKK